MGLLGTIDRLNTELLLIVRGIAMKLGLLSLLTVATSVVFSGPGWGQDGELCSAGEPCVLPGPRNGTQRMRESAQSQMSIFRNALP